MGRRSAAAEKTPRADFIDARGRGYLDPFELLVNGFPAMVRNARAARLEDSPSGRSYRRYLVGSIFGATNPDLSLVGFYKGNNTKPRPDSLPVCSEKRSTRTAEKNGTDIFFGGVITGEPQLDEHSGLYLPTLHCCFSCRMNILAKKVLDEAPIATVLPDKDAFQIMTGSSMIGLHERAARGEDVWEPPLFHDPGFHRWERSHGMYRELIPEGTDTMSTPEARRAASHAAMTAITGYSLSLTHRGTLGSV